MKPSLLDSLSKHQFLLTSVVIGLFLASGAFFSTKMFKSQTAYTAASCYPNSEIQAKKSELASLNDQVTTLQNEIFTLEQSISSQAGSSFTYSYTIDELNTKILSDYALEQKKQEMESICSAAPINTNCGSITDQYSCTKSNGCIWGGGSASVLEGATNGYCSGSSGTLTSCSSFNGNQSACNDSGHSGCAYDSSDSTCQGDYIVYCTDYSNQGDCSSHSCMWTDGSPGTWTNPTPDYCYNNPNITISSNNPSCTEATAYYESVKTNNEYYKNLLANLMAQGGSSTMEYLVNTLSEKRAALQDLTNNKIPVLTQLITFEESNPCPVSETSCSNGVDDDVDGAGDCDDTDCSGTTSCQGGNGGNTNVYGCTDSKAKNYNPNANIEDYSCIYPKAGCTNSSATNYDPNAEIDDGSCNYVGGEVCNDGTDNDGDSMVDCGDSDCFGDAACKVVDICAENADKALEACRQTCSDDAGSCRVNCPRIPDPNAISSCPTVPEPGCEYMCSVNTDYDPTCISSCPTIIDPACIANAPTIPDPSCVAACDDNEQSCLAACEVERSKACKGVECVGASCPQPLTSCAICEYGESDGDVFRKECEYLKTINDEIQHVYTEWHNVSEAEASNQDLFKNKCQKTARSFRDTIITHSCSLNFDKATNRTKSVIAALTDWKIDWKETDGKEIKIIDSGCNSIGGFLVMYRNQADASFSLAMSFAQQFKGTLIQGGNQTIGYSNVLDKAPGYVTYTGHPPNSGPINKSNITLAPCPEVGFNGPKCYTDHPNPNADSSGMLEQEPILCGDSDMPLRYYCDALIPPKPVNGGAFYEGRWKASHRIGYQL